MSKTYFVHAGAHRSGSSSFQMCLAENRSQLEQLGFDLLYPRRDGQPGGRPQMTLPSKGDDYTHRAHLVEKLQKRFANQYPDDTRPLILSEENILGRIRPSLEGKFFPVAQRRAAVIRRAAGVPQEVLMVLRPYASYYRSIYRLRASGNPVQPFQTFLPPLLQGDRGWADVVRDVRAGFECDTVTVVDFAKRGESRDLLRCLVPALRGITLKEPQTRVNLSPTDAALQDLQARFAAGEAPSHDMTRAVMAEHAQDRRDLGLTQYTAAQEQVFADMYARDLDILADMEGVTLIC